MAIISTFDAVDEQPVYRPLVINFLELRRAIGVLGLLLPIVLALSGLQPSISAYHATSMRDVFVGTLCAIGAFLLAYRGYDRADRALGIVAGAALVGVALLPFDGPRTAAPHALCALAFFLATTAFCLARFTRTSGEVTPRKRQRNRVYRACGAVILVSIIGAIAGGPLFWLESIATVAFGAAWLVKGEAILADT